MIGNLSKKYSIMAASLFMGACTAHDKLSVEPSASDLHFTELAKSWDEGIPLGNATVGALIWQRDSLLRFSLDRSDLWDLRPIEEYAHPEFSFNWVKEQLDGNNYSAVHEKFDRLYDKVAAPSKLPGAALEFSQSGWGKPVSVHLYLNNALCEVRWSNGVVLKTFVHATEPVGWFVFENLPADVHPVLSVPGYGKADHSENGNSLGGISLGRLGYTQGKVDYKDNEITYHQKGWNDFYYDVNVRWKRSTTVLSGTWSVTSSLSEDIAGEETAAAMERGVYNDYREHLGYWNKYWAASSISVPDTLLQKQYDNEMYKFGSALREDSYPISLQAVWTADDGNLPPWKGDYHHDLNTQLSYWPAYTGNHLSEGLGYLNTLWSQRDNFKAYTRKFFGCEGMNVPGVCTLDGKQMGGWTQYSMSATVGAWLSQHFYLHWKYSSDRLFLKERAYPFIKDVAVFLEQFTEVNKDGIRQLPLSSSPEIYDNSPKAWFRTMTNYDLALVHFVFKAASELAFELKLSDEAKHWEYLETQLPDFDKDDSGALTFAKGFPYNESHRHFSHAMAIHPLGLIDYSQGDDARKTIQATIAKLKEMGPDYWCGYSYSWFANICARAFDGNEAVEALRIFAECFCLPNTFHANGDQSRSGKSTFTYRPFTLEGNFAFAAAVQEMLLQSHTGTVIIFPAIPDTWKDVSFEHLRAMGGFLISAKLSNGKIQEAEIKAEQSGVCRIMLTDKWEWHKMKVKGSNKTIDCKDNVITVSLEKGEAIYFCR